MNDFAQPQANGTVLSLFNVGWTHIRCPVGFCIFALRYCQLRMSFLGRDSVMS